MKFLHQFLVLFFRVFELSFLSEPPKLILLRSLFLPSLLRQLGYTCVLGFLPLFFGLLLGFFLFEVHFGYALFPLATLLFRELLHSIHCFIKKCIGAIHYKRTPSRAPVLSKMIHKTLTVFPSEWGQHQPKESGQASEGLSQRALTP